MTAAITVAEFAARTVMPSEDVDRLETQYAGFLDAQIASAQAWIDARLSKRYAIPFASPVPEVYLGWIVALVTLQAYQRRGWNPTSAENTLVIEAVKQAKDEIKEAADSATGLYELPLRQDRPGVSGVTYGGPLGYSEASPWDWTDRQIETVRGGS